ncbi:hypothetical protein GP644_05475 [Parasedimentitalea maritima]|uniref:Uncharacterized protein n=1 Tax=Parasedimentitalea maritima TaxID=2578117 RepID=A0A6A4RK85_9RHOB|nr:hypothetical protein GP644_05475 [Zongyanglinia marina]
MTEFLARHLLRLGNFRSPIDRRRSGDRATSQVVWKRQFCSAWYAVIKEIFATRRKLFVGIDCLPIALRKVPAMKALEQFGVLCLIVYAGHCVGLSGLFG